MTATVTQPQSTARTQLSGAAAALNSLASATYVVLGTITHATNDPLESKIEVSVTPGTVTGNKQVVLFAQASIDGTNFETGPTSGTTSTDESNLRYVGTVPCRTNSTLQRKVMDLSAAYPSGQLPYATKLIAKNDTGAALASSGNDIYSDEYNALIT
jgi:hypothetical protein